MHSSKVFWVNGKAVFIFVLNKHYNKSFGYMEMRFLFLYIDYALQQWRSGDNNFNWVAG
jgi:hypothetical protein